MTQPSVPTFDYGISSVTQLNQLADAARFLLGETGEYQPLLSATVAPALGASGFLNGVFWRTGYKVTAIIDLNLEGAGISIVGASWRISLPYLADMSLHVAGVLDAESHQIGSFDSRSDTAADSRTGAVLLAGPTGNDTEGTYMIFYPNASNGSIGSTSFTTDARIKAVVQYVADPTLTAVV